MISTKNFRQHHEELIQVAKEMSAQLTLENLKKDASGIRTLLSKLSGKLSVHLSMEDNSLYPAIANHPDSNLKSTADRFVREMSGIKAAFEEYKQKWGTSAAIQANAAEFIQETKNIFSALSKRIEKEDKELYALVDKIMKAA